MTTIAFLPHEVFALSDADRNTVPALRETFRRFWSAPLAAAAPRIAYDAFFAATPPAPNVSLHPSTAPGLPGWVCVPNGAIASQALLYVHGGAYTMGTAPAYRGLVSQIAARAQRTSFILEYPLAPETTLPAAIDLAVGAIEHLRERYEKVGVIGDSAGGGLTLATLTRAANVDAAVVFSPWTDLTLSGASLRERAASDVLLDEAALREAARCYIGDAAADDSSASPLWAIPQALPPLLIQVGADEILYDDARLYAQRAHAYGHQVTLQEWTDMHHVFQMNIEQLDASRQAVDLAASFLNRHMEHIL